MTPPTGFVFMGLNFLLPDYILLAVSTLNFILSIFIFANDPKNKINLSFAFFAFFISSWPITLLLFRISSIEYADFWMRVSYIMAAGIAISFWFFSRYFPVEVRHTFWNSLIPLLSTFILFALFFIPNFLVQEVADYPGIGRVVISERFGHALFSLYFLGFFFGAIVYLRTQCKRAAGAVKKQALVLFYGVLFSGVFGVFFNLILPSPYFQNFSYIYLGPLFTFTFIAAVSYAVAKHQMMNIKALATEFFVIIILITSLVQVFLSSSILETTLRAIFSLVILLFGILLIRSVVSEVKRREETAHLAHALKQANLRLQELDRQKTEFLSIASHQLRTPLSVIKGYAELLVDGAYGKLTKGAVEILGNMDSSNEHLIKLVDEFLDISRIEQGRTKYVFKQDDLTAIITSVVEELKMRAQGAGLALSWKPTTRLSADIDSEKIRHVVFNFVDNAIKYSVKGDVVISAQEDVGGVKVCVKDRGVGFGKADEANFFQKFYRGENVKATNVNGTGLGLYVCRMFIEAHQGKVWAHSAGLGKGSEFGFWVPIKPKI